MEIRDVAKANASRWNPSRHIGHAIFDRNLCETLVAVFRVTSHRSHTKTPDPFSSFSPKEAWAPILVDGVFIQPSQSEQKTAFSVLSYVIRCSSP